MRIWFFLAVLSASVIGCSMATKPQKKPRITSAQRYYEEGTKLLDSDPEKAIELLSQSLELEPNAPPAIYNRVAALARVGRDAEAVADIERLEQVAPQLGRSLRAEMKLSAVPYTDLAVRALNNQDFDQAIKMSESALAYDPGYGVAWSTKGLAMMELGMIEQARPLFERGVETEPDDFFVYYARGEFHRRGKRVNEALADFSKSIELRPTEHAYRKRAEVYQEEGKSAESESDIKKADELKTSADSPAGM